MGGSAYLVNLDTRIFADHPGSRARCIQQNPIKTAHHLWELSSVIVAHHDILAAHPVHVCCKRLCSLLIRVIRKYRASVLKKGRNVSRLSARRGSHVKNAFIGLRSQGDNGEERRGGLKHVVASQVFGGRTLYYSTQTTQPKDQAHRSGHCSRRLGDRLCSISLLDRG